MLSLSLHLFSLSPTHTYTVTVHPRNPTCPTSSPTGEGPPATPSFWPTSSRPELLPARVAVACLQLTNRATGSSVRRRTAETPRHRPSSAQPRSLRCLAAPICTRGNSNQLRWRAVRGAAKASWFAVATPRQGCRISRLPSLYSEQADLSSKVGHTPSNCSTHFQARDRQNPFLLWSALS